jgi:hypothetical protein
VLVTLHQYAPAIGPANRSTLPCNMACEAVTVMRPMHVKAPLERHLWEVKSFMTKTWRWDLGAYIYGTP